MSLTSLALSITEDEQLFSFLKKSEVFFKKSEEEKKLFCVSGGAHNFRGYFAYKTQNYDVNQKKKDLKEGYDFGSHQLDRGYNHFFGKNIVASEFAQQKEIFAIFEKKAKELIFAVHKKISPENATLLDYFTNPISNLRVLHYPNVENSSDHQIHLVDHYDPGFSTLIYSNEPGTEYFCLNKNQWVEVPFLEKTLTVIFGQTAQRWSEGRIIAPLHRILKLKTPRTSLCFFHNPNFFAKIVSINKNDIFDAGRFIYCESVENNTLHQQLYDDILENKIY
jgi:isopenicillin N synthase-like dioxygenase